MPAPRARRESVAARLCTTLNALLGTIAVPAKVRLPVSAATGTLVGTMTALGHGSSLVQGAGLGALGGLLLGLALLAVPAIGGAVTVYLPRFAGRAQGRLTTPIVTAPEPHSNVRLIA